ncbi:MAG: HEAT repeat domain-containing protein, partial [Candidatus Brocadiales bacterium]
GRFRQTGATILLREELVEGDIPPVRYDVARALGEIGDATVVGVMIRVMDDGAVDWRIKGACAGALGEIGDPSAVTELGELLMENTGQPFSVWTRYRAAWALSSMGEDSLMVLLEALRDDEELIRRKSAWALIRIGPPAIPALVRALRDPYARVRERAALAMGWIGDSKAIPSLVRSIYDENFKVRQAVVWAIGHIGGVRADKVLAELVDSDDDERIKELAGEAIAKKSKKYKGASR